MKFSIKREVLLKALEIVSHAIPQKTPMPQLTGVKMEFSKEHIFMVGSNSDIVITYNLQDESYSYEGNGDNLLVPFSTLYTIIQKLKEGNVTFELQENQINIKGGRSKFKLALMDYNEYPNYILNDQNEAISLKSTIIKDMIKETSFSCATNERKPILMGVNLRTKENNLECVATDSYRLSKKIVDIKGSIENLNITIPSKSLLALSKLIGNYEDDLDLYLNGNTLLFSFNNTMFQTRLLDGNYPDTSKLIPPSSVIDITFDREDLLDALNRVSILCPTDSSKDKEITYSIVKFCANKDGDDYNVLIEATNQALGKAEELLEPMSINLNGENLKIGFSSKYLIEALNSFDCDLVVLRFNGNLRPFTITNPENNELIQLVLPVRLD